MAPTVVQPDVPLGELSHRKDNPPDKVAAFDKDKLVDPLEQTVSIVASTVSYAGAPVQAGGV